MKYSKFSTEEWRILTPLKKSVGGVKEATSGSLDEYHKYQSRNKSLASLQSLYTGPPSPSTFDPDDNMDNETVDQFQWFDTEVDLSLDDYHTHVASAADANPSKIGGMPMSRRREHRLRKRWMNR